MNSKKAYYVFHFICAIISHISNNFCSEYMKTVGFPVYSHLSFLLLFLMLNVSFDCLVIFKFSFKIGYILVNN